MRSSKNSFFFHTYSKEIPLLNIDSYFQEYKDLLYRYTGSEKNAPENKKSEKLFYARVLDLSPEQVDQLDVVTSIENLKCDGEIEPLEHNLHESHADFEMKYEMAQIAKYGKHDLISVERRKEVSGKQFGRYNLKYGHYIWLGVETYPSVTRDLNPFDFSTIVFCVKIYHPYLSSFNRNCRVKLLQEIHILGDQYLTDLKDAIVCSMDYTGVSDVSEKISDYISPCRNEYSIEKKEIYLSSFIFIENHFFNETRHPSAEDLSKTIIEWTKEKKLGPFTAGSIENVKMMDLKIRIGQPYVYQHQGDCEHVLIFSDVRFLQKSDSHKKCAYPYVYAKGRCSGKLCMMCGVSYARWFVVGNARLTHDKSYFCSRCFVSYNYIDGKKVGDFKAFEYVDSIAVL